jgi:hypothetical protein
MKSKDEIEEMLDRIDSQAPTKFPGMTYEGGLEEALRWVLGEIEDDELSV